jgi:hypothetical protein
MSVNKKAARYLWVAVWAGELGWFHQVFDTKKAAKRFFDLHKPDIPELELFRYERKG